MARCKYDSSSYCAKYGCNACESYPRECSTCDNGHWKEEDIDQYECSLDGAIYDGEHTCKNWKKYW